MYIIKQDSKKIISVLGAPHSGTTIVNNIINSMDNAFCISEPHWVLMRNVKKLRLDKVNKIEHTSYNDFMKGVRKKLNHSKFDFGGVKETYRSQDGTMQETYNKILKHSDIIILVYRDPIAIYNSQKSIRKNKSDENNDRAISGLIRNFRSQCELGKKYKNKVVNIVLEDLCAAGNAKAIEYLNKVCYGKLEVEGKFKLNKTDFIFGNPKANRSARIAPANMKSDLVKGNEKKRLQKIYPVYKSFRVSL